LDKHPENNTGVFYTNAEEPEDRLYSAFPVYSKLGRAASSENNLFTWIRRKELPGNQVEIKLCTAAK